MAAIGRVDIGYSQPGSLGLVLDKALQLGPCPSVQTGTHALTCPDSPADIGEVFHHNRAGTVPECFRDNGLADFMVDLFHVPLLLARDFPQQLLCRLRTVGLKATTKRKVPVPVMAQLTSFKNFTAGGSRHIVFAQINAESEVAPGGRPIRKLKNEIEKPLATPKNQLRFFGGTLLKIGFLKRSGLHLNFGPSSKSVKRNYLILDAVSALIKMDTPIRLERNYRNFFSLLGFQGPIGITHSFDAITNHLRAKLRLLSDRVISQVMQSNLIPTTMFDSKRHNGIAGMGKRLLQAEKCLTLLFGGKQFDRYGTLHVGQYTVYQIASQQQKGGKAASSASTRLAVCAARFL
nr:hypothetical protein [Candidatus Hakubella thermalkaliphila]